MITPGLGSVAADTRGARRTVGGHPVAENTFPTHETPAACRGIVPLIVPTAVNEQSHFILLATHRRASEFVGAGSSSDTPPMIATYGPRRRTISDFINVNLVEAINGFSHFQFRR